MDIRLRIYTPSGAPTGTFLTDFLQVEPVTPFGDMSVLRVDYPRGGLNWTVFSNITEIAVEVEKGGQWVEPPGCRFLHENASVERLDDVQVDRATLVGMDVHLLGAHVQDTTGLPKNEDGKFMFKGAANAGTILSTFLNGSQALGWGKGLTFDFTATTDSAGKPWVKTIANISYGPEISVLDVLRNLFDQGVIDYRWQGRTLQAYNPDTAMGRATGVRIATTEGQTSQPETISFKDLATNVIVIGDDGKTWDFPTGWISPTGRVNKVILQGSVSDPGTARLLADPTIVAGSQARLTFTPEFDLTQDVDSAPLRNIIPGDWIDVQHGTVFERLRVVSLSVRKDANKTTGYLVLGSRIDDLLSRLAKKQRGIDGGATIGGNGVKPTPEGKDNRTPFHPTGLVLRADVYPDQDGAPRGLIQAGWSHAGTATDGTPMDVDRYQLDWRINATGEPWKFFGSTDDKQIIRSGIPIYKADGTVQSYALRVRAIGRNGNASIFGPVSAVSMEVDKTPPPVPQFRASDLTIWLRTVKAVWSGKGVNGTQLVNMPMDFQAIRAYVGTAPDQLVLVAEAPVKQGQVLSWESHHLANNTTVYVALSAVDSSGNESAKSTVQTVVSRANVDTSSIITELDAANVQIKNARLALLDSGTTLDSKLKANDAAQTALQASQSQLRTDLDAARVRLSQAEKDLDQAEADLATANTKITANTNDLTKAKADLDAANVKITANTNDLTKAKADLDAANVKITANTNDLTKAKSDIVAANSKITANTNDLTKAKSDLDAANVKITKNTSDLVAANSRIASAQGEIDTLKQSAGKWQSTGTGAPTTSLGNGVPVGGIYTRLDSTGKTLGVWRWDGSKWVEQPLDATFIPQIDIGSGTFGNLDGVRLKAASVYADKVVVGVGSNFIPNAGAESGITSPHQAAPTTTMFEAVSRPEGGKAGKFMFRAQYAGHPNNGNFQTLFYVQPNPDTPFFPVQSDQDYLFSTWYKASGVVQSGDYNVQLIADFYDAEGKYVAPGGTIGSPISAKVSWTWTQLVWEINRSRIPAVAQFVRLAVRGNCSNTYEFDDLFYGPQIPGTLLVNGTITSVNMAADSIGTRELIASSVTTAQLAANAVTAGKIAADAIGTRELIAGSVVSSQLAANAVTAGKIAADSVGTRELIASSVTASQLAANAVTAGKIAADSVGTRELIASSVTASQLAANAVTAGKIAADTVGAREIAANSIVASHIVAGAIVGSRIAANTITAREIAANTITAGQINSQNVAADLAQFIKLDVGNLVAGSASIQTGVIDKLWADFARFKKVMTDQLYVGGQNLVGDAGLTDATMNAARVAYASGNDWAVSSDTEGGSANVARLAPQKDTYSNFFPNAPQTQMTPVTPGDEYLFRWEYRARGGTNSGGVAEARTAFNCYDATGRYIRFASSDSFTGINTSGPNWNTVEGKIIVPSDTYFVLPAVQARNTRYTSYLEFRGFTFQKKADAALVVDGTITGTKLVANTITGREIRALAITADLIASNAITTDKIAAGAVRAGNIAANSVTSTELTSTAINGMTITGATFQTTVNAFRGIKISSTLGIASYNSAGQKVIDIPPNGGDATITGNFATAISPAPRVILESTTNLGEPGIFFMRDGSTVNGLEAAIYGNMASGSAGPESSSLTVRAARSKNSDGSYFASDIRGPINMYGSTLMCMPGASSMFTITTSSGDLTIGSQGKVWITGKQVVSYPVYNDTTAWSPNMAVSSDGLIRRSSSASRYKLDKRTMTVPEAILDIQPKDWIDKADFERARDLENLGVLKEEDAEQLEAIKAQLVRVPGVIAEDLLALGLNEFVTFGTDGEVEGVLYDRLGVATIPHLKRAHTRITELENTITGLEERLNALEAA